MTTLPKCNCGSGLNRRPLIDEAGIVCCYVCDLCEQKKHKTYLAEIFGDSHPYTFIGKQANRYLAYD
jgi:hypothetical protein